MTRTCPNLIKSFSSLLQLGISRSVFANGICIIAFWICIQLLLIYCIDHPHFCGNTQLFLDVCKARKKSDWHQQLIALNTLCKCQTALLHTIDSARPYQHVLSFLFPCFLIGEKASGL